MTQITVKFQKLIRYNHEILLIKHAKSNQVTHLVRYKRVFVDRDCSRIGQTELECLSQNSNRNEFFAFFDVQF